MKIKEGFRLRDVCGAKVLTPQGIGNVDLNALIVLNETSCYLFEQLKDRDAFTIDDMVNLLTAEYEVSEEQARQDCENLLQEWSKIQLCE